MWFNSKQRAEPYRPLTCPVWVPEMEPFSSAGGNTGAAWLSSARVVRCWVKSRNERNPCELLPPTREGRALCSDCPVKRGGRWGRRQVSMALTARAAHVLQCPVQNDPRPQGGGNLSKLGPVRIGVCNSTP